MTLVRPSFVLAAATERPLARWELSTAGLQLVQKGAVIWAKKGAWFRNPPYTVGPWAHTGQLEVRAEFGKLAQEAAGKSAEEIARIVGGTVIEGKTGKLIQMPDGRILPPVAAYIAAKMKGFRAPHALKPEEYPSRKRRTAYTLAQIEKELEARGVSAPAARAARR